MICPDAGGSELAEIMGSAIVKLQILFLHIFKGGYPLKFRPDIYIYIGLIYGRYLHFFRFLKWPLTKGVKPSINQPTGLWDIDDMSLLLLALKLHILQHVNDFAPAVN